MPIADPLEDPRRWQTALVERWGPDAAGPIGWWNSLNDDERSEVDAARLDELCRELSLVEMIAMSTERDTDVVICERVACAHLPRADRLLAWLGVT